MAVPMAVATPPTMPVAVPPNLVDVPRRERGRDRSRR
jgi:hypothetical protein